MITSHVEARRYLIDYLRRDLVGPRGESETLSEIPTTHYLTGILYPRDTITSVEEDDESDAASEGDDEPDIGAPQLNASLPSAIGMSFIVRGTTEPFSVHATAAHYVEQLAEQPGASATSGDDAAAGVPGTPSNTGAAALQDAAAADGRRARPRKYWDRVSLSTEPALTCSTPGSRSERVTLCPGLELQVLIRPAGGDRLVTATLVNLRPGRPGGQGMVDVTNCFFQPRITVRPARAGADIFVARQPLHLESSDEDVALNRLLYRHATEYAIGHGCAVDWQPRGDRPPTSLTTAIIPEYELPTVVAEENFDGPALDMNWLAHAGFDDLTREIVRMLGRYRTWIERLRIEAAALPTHFADQAQQNVMRCEEAYQRMRAGLELLGADPAARAAFQQMCGAMRDQRRQSLLAAHKIEPDKEVRTNWRPFQLAFILMCLPSCTDPRDQYHDVVDLLWFPTGGGKTEAYLGLTAYTILLRRLRTHTNPARGNGTAVLMRYTLRLLTIQQFQRAATLVCALELLRRADAANLGTVPITVGLWVGGSTTPNTIAQARTSLDELRRGEPGHNGSPRQLEKCPWCGTPIETASFTIPPAGDRLITRCLNQDCPFHGAEGLPIRVVDDDIYREPPALLIAVVDKFAQMPWSSKVGALFGHRAGAQPPSLIVQDEMHLIAGPLGTLVGLYETAIDALASADGIAPKVIASTATIRRAADQSRGLFNRRVRQFPPPGLDARDSFFAVAKSLDELPGRLYLGVQAPGRSGKTVQVRIMAALLQGTYTMDAPRAIKDPYLTLVGYYNSLRELGGAVRLVEDDVPDRIKVLATGESRTAREIQPADELTSRRDSSEIPELLERMATALDDGGMDVLLATNMISVGVDVDRLSLMAVIGQPKTTAEYIQASSRVGRMYPGLVVTMYQASRPRDRSHYERFTAYHAALYSQVEATSVTPFSARSRDRGLHAVLISLMRHAVPGMADEHAPHLLGREQAQELADVILKRVREAEPDEAEATAQQLDEILRRWEALVALHGKRLRYGHPPFTRGSPDPYVMHSADRVDLDPAEDETGSFPTLNSLRAVEPSSPLYLQKGANRGTR